MNRLLFALAFALGSAAVIWMALIFAGGDALAFTVTAVIGGVFVLGAIELLGFRKATASLATALNELDDKKEAPESLEPWINKLAPVLRNATQARIEGERVALPAPVLTPYLVGLLVMLGLLGTFIGMVETLQGAVTALESNSELQAIRAGLAAPIQGLGLAFGTSVAGVAASAMLGLMSTLSRRARIFETQRLDQKINSSLRTFSLNHSRQQTYRALQLQADTLPAVAERLDSLAHTLENMGEKLGQNLANNQNELNQSLISLFGNLATTVEKTLGESVAETSRLSVENSRLVGESIKPVLQETLGDIQSELQRCNDKSLQQLADNAESTQQQLLEQTQQCLQELNGKTETVQKQITELSTATLEQLKNTAQDNQQALISNAQETLQKIDSNSDATHKLLQESTEKTLSQLRDSSLATEQKLEASSAATHKLLQEATEQTLSQLRESSIATGQKLEESGSATQQRITELAGSQLQALSAHFSNSAQDVAQAWQQGLEAHQEANQSLLAQGKDNLNAYSTEFERLSKDLMTQVEANSNHWLQQQQEAEQLRVNSWQAALETNQQQSAKELQQNAAEFNQQLQEQSQHQQHAIEQLLTRFENVSNELNTQWRENGEQHKAQQQELAQTLQQSAQDMNSHWLQNAKQMLEQINGLMASSEQLLQQRMDSETEWLTAQQQRMCEVSNVLGEQLEQLRLQEQSRGEAAVAQLGELEATVANHLAGLGQSLEAPMTRLIETASEAPRAAAEVIEHLRAEISKNIERDNGLLSERRDVLVELNSLSESIQQTAAGQQQAIESLVSESTDKLDTIGEQFTQQVADESEKLNDMVALFAGSSAELASLGEAFSLAVEMFRDSNTAMTENLARIESSLSEAGNRSDEQLGYYVAQAREIIDQSIVSQQQMLDGLRQLREEKAVN